MCIHLCTSQNTQNKLNIPLPLSCVPPPLLHTEIVSKCHSGTGHHGALHHRTGSVTIGGAGILTLHSTVLYLRLCTVLMLVLEAGYAHAVLQNVDIMADGTKASSLSRTLSKQHNVKHFTLYQHKQKDTPIATNVHPYHSQNTSWHPTKGANTDTKRPPLEAMSGDGCIIEVGKTVNMSSSCNCTRHETKLSILDQALNCAKQNSNTVVELKLKIKQLQLHQTHYFEAVSYTHLTLPTIYSV